MTPFLFVDGPLKGRSIPGDFKHHVHRIGDINWVYYKDTYAIITSINGLTFRLYFDIARYNLLPPLQWMIDNAFIFVDVLDHPDFMKDFEGWFYARCCELYAPYPGIRETVDFAKSKLIQAEIVPAGGRIKVVR